MCYCVHNKGPATPLWSLGNDACVMSLLQHLILLLAEQKKKSLPISLVQTRPKRPSIVCERLFSVEAVSIPGAEGRGRNKAFPSESEMTIAIEKSSKSCQNSEHRGPIHPSIVSTEPCRLYELLASSAIWEKPLPGLGQCDPGQSVQRAPHTVRRVGGLQRNWRMQKNQGRRDIDIAPSRTLVGWGRGPKTLFSFPTSQDLLSVWNSEIYSPIR